MKQIKSWKRLLPAALCLSILPVVPAQATEEDYAAAYADFLNTYEYAAEYPEVFALACIDGDQIPELLLIGPSDFHPAKVTVYTCVDGAVKKVGAYGEWGGAAFALGQGCIQNCYAGTGYELTEYYSYQSGTTALLKRFTSEEYDMESGEFTDVYTIDGNRVSQAEFEVQSEAFERQSPYIFTDVDASAAAMQDGFTPDHIRALRSSPEQFFLEPTAGESGAKEYMNAVRTWADWAASILLRFCRNGLK